MTECRGLTIAEGEADEVVSFATRAELEAFAAGLTHGANLYGAGGCGLYTMEDVPDLEAGDDRELAALVRKHLGAGDE